MSTITGVVTNGVVVPSSPLPEGARVEIMLPVRASTAETAEQRVTRLLARWRDETAHLSSTTRITSHPAYLELIELGPLALPSIFRDLEKTDDGHLSRALTAITGAHPIPSDERGQIRKIAQAWLRWARENGYQW